MSLIVFSGSRVSVEKNQVHVECELRELTVFFAFFFFFLSSAAC